MQHNHNWLPDRVPTLSNNQQAKQSHSLSQSSADAAASMDMQSLLRTSTAIAAEIAIDRFLERLMDIIMENAGATKGILILNRQGTPIVASQKDINKQAAALQATPLKDYHQLPHTLIQYTQNTHEVVLLQNAQVSTQFARDPYLSSSAVKSVLCLPILHQGKRSGNHIPGKQPYHRCLHHTTHNLSKATAGPNSHIAGKRPPL